IGNRILKIAPDGKIAAVAVSSAAVGGLACDGEALYASLPGKKQIVRLDSGKEVLAHERVPAHDLAARDGRVWFTAPEEKALFLAGRDAPAATGPVLPSGLALWNDGATLVAGDAAGRHLYAYRMGPEGTLDAAERYYALRVRPKQSSAVRALV